MAVARLNEKPNELYDSEEALTYLEQIGMSIRKSPAPRIAYQAIEHSPPAEQQVFQQPFNVQEEEPSEFQVNPGFSAPATVATAPTAANVLEPNKPPQNNTMPYSKTGELCKTDNFMASPIIHKYVKFVIENINKQSVGPDDEKRILRIKRISSEQNLATNLMPMMEVLENKNEAQLNEIFDLFAVTFLDEAANLFSDTQSVDSKFSWMPMMLQEVCRKANQLGATSPVTCFFRHILLLSPVTLGCYTQVETANVDSYTALFLMALLFIPVISHKSFFEQICLSQKYCIEELQRSKTEGEIDDFCCLIMQFLSGVLKFTQYQKQFSQQDASTCFNYNPFGDGSRLSDYARNVLAFIRNKMSYQFIEDDLRSL